MNTEIDEAKNLVRLYYSPLEDLSTWSVTQYQKLLET